MWPSQLQEGECPTDTPKNNATMAFSKYFKLVENHVWAASLVGQNYTPEQAIHLVMANLHAKYKTEFMEGKLQLENRVQGFTFDLKFAHLASTMEKWALKFGMDLPGRTSVRMIHMMDDGFSTEEEADVNAIGGTKKVCADCGKPGHTSEACNVNINFLLAKSNMANKPHVAKSIETIQAKYI